LEGICSCLILRHYPGIRLDVLRKTTKNFIQDSLSPGRDLNMWPPEYEVASYLRDILHKVKFCKITHSILQYEEDVILIAPIQASRRVTMKASNVLCKNRKEIFWKQCVLLIGVGLWRPILV
jgi:hypothetical protein